jgi:ribonuclease-3
VSYEDLQQRLGFRFRDVGLLRQALTHRSHSTPHNERLEFLGDGVLNCVIAAELFTRFPGLREGELSRLRASLVRGERLHELANALGFASDLRLGEGELKSGGSQRPSILANVVEALIGAMYLDAGYDTTRAVVRRLYEPLLEALDERGTAKDPKTQLQEWLQSRKYALPQYSVIATRGAAHDQRFEVECLIRELDLRTVGSGTSRRLAEQAAAQIAYERLRE